MSISGFALRPVELDSFHSGALKKSARSKTAQFPQSSERDCLFRFRLVAAITFRRDRRNGRKNCERDTISKLEGTMSSKGEVANLRVKDLNVFESTPGLADALSASLNAAYLEYFTADCSGTSTKEAERRIAAIPEDKRYLTRVLDSLDSAFADFDTETALLDLPHMQNRKPEAIKSYLEFRLRQFKMLIDAVEDYVGEKYPATGGQS